jgi:hypothetical protein
MNAKNVDAMNATDAAVEATRNWESARELWAAACMTVAAAEYDQLKAADALRIATEALDDAQDAEYAAYVARTVA